MKYRLLLFFAIAPSFIQAQYNGGMLVEYFYGRLMSTRAEAMGMTSITNTGEAQSAIYNPAVIGLFEEKQVGLLYSSPYYLLRNARYHDISVAIPVNKMIGIGFHSNSFHIGATDFTLNINNNDYIVDKPYNRNNVITVAAQVLEGLSIGINANWFRWKYINASPRAKSILLDFGIIYKKSLKSNIDISAAISVSNFTKSKIELIGDSTDQFIGEMPSNLKFGFGFEKVFTGNLCGLTDREFKLSASFEYNDVLNYDFYTSYHAGFELWVMQLLALRMGYYSRTLDQKGFTQYNYDHISDLTYGFALGIPANTISKGKLPFNLTLDITVLKEEEVSKAGRIGDFRSISLNCFWVPKAKN